MDAATGIDLVRLAAIPLFLYTAVTDIKQRRAPDWVWSILVTVAIALLAVEVLLVVPPMTSAWGRIYIIETAAAILLAVGLGFIGHVFGLMGGADTKAIITVGLLYPTFPYAVLGQYGLPVSGVVSITSIDMIANGFILASVYPVAVTIHNLRRSNIYTRMFLILRKPVDTLPSTYGRVAATSSGLSRTSVDLDTLRMYLAWRQATVTDIQTRPEVYRSSDTPTSDCVGDGTIESYERLVDDSVPSEDVTSEPNTTNNEDPWRINEFAAHPDTSLYGTPPEKLRDLLENIADASKTSLWVSPGIPLLVPFAAGVVFTLIYGSLIGAVFI